MQDFKILFILFIIIQCLIKVNTELTPPYFNLAEGRKIYSSATCGVGTDGPELYCKLVGAVGNESERLIQGQVCDYCDPSIPEKHHPPEYAIDGTEKWWQSPPLSRGMKYNEVNLTIDFGQEFHVAYLFLRMGNSPRPGLWTVEKSSDYGKTWTPWQHFSDTPTDCELYFGKDSFKPITRDDDVICTTEYSKIVPLEGGEIPVMLLNNRPSANNYFNSTVLQEWTRATNVRIRLLRTKTLLGHLMSVARQDPTVTRRYFYSIKDISIGGRCVCNGHASTCHVLDELSPNRLLACQCQHNTCGIQCSECCPGFEQKKWRQNTKAHPFKCEPCNCFGHSKTCTYSEEVDEQHLSLDIHGNYEGGGVCENCQHNTMGINCNKCKPKFYRPHGRLWNDTNVCQPCNCDYDFSTGECSEGSGQCECRIEFQEPDCKSCSYGYFDYPNCKPCECFLNGTIGYYCEASYGKCPCKENFGGNYCKQCADGYYDFPNCTECKCNPVGTIEGKHCDQVTGQCPCNSNFAGRHCDQCKNGFYDYPTCVYANCDIHGTVEEICDKQSGKCLCKEGYGGYRCDQCLPGYYNYPDCIPCNCSIPGSISTNCDTLGKCQCVSAFAGKQCTSCAVGYYKYPECIPCNCSEYGSNGKSCNADGQCKCYSNFDGVLCEKCKEGFYNFPACEECNCDPAGVITKFAGCGSVPEGELCQCKDRVQGRICNECKPTFWNLTVTNPHGCQECDCFADGTIGALDTCDIKTGQCICKSSVGSRDCSECKDGSFDLYGQNLFGCKDCGCDKGGALNPICDKESGQCKCHPRIAGRTCTHPVTTHYFPTLYQFQFEYEDGYNPSGGFVRYKFDENIFPGYSKKGYAVISHLQNEILNDVDIIKSSVYRMIIRYVNRNPTNVAGNILITSENPNEVDQSAKVTFPPTSTPSFVTVAGITGPSALVLDPGHYTISLKVDKSSLFLDYFVLLPAAYYEATILTKEVETPCEIANLALCRHYKYPSITDYGPITQALVPLEDKLVRPAEMYAEIQHLSTLEEDFMTLITHSQQKLNYGLNVTKSGKYIIIVDYVSDIKYPEVYTVLKTDLLNEDDHNGFVTIYPCIYTTVCRQPIVDEESREKIFNLSSNYYNVLQITGDDSSRVAIKSVTAIPIEDWSLDFIQPKSVCVMKNGKCVQGSFRSIPDAKRIEFELDHEHMIARNNPPYISDNNTKLIYLDHDNSTIQVKTKVSNPGPYHILIKYYQPHHPDLDVLFKIETSREVHTGKLRLPNCPSNIGCRELILLENDIPWLDIENNITITVTNENRKGVWLDFILLVPSEEYTKNLLIEEPFDQTKEFIEECGQNHFHIQLNASEFCRKTVFSLTADYNGGALPCNCDYEGSTSFECDPFGGQCQCRNDVIGRRCDACRTGYYGFPECKPCNCPSTALCEKDTGECICPSQVMGEKCDKCIPYTFGFDPINGCESCNCNQLGVMNGNLQCDLNNGSCQCYPNIIGRMCDRCTNGFFQFPECRPCNCDIRGTTEEICDQEYETCFCKKHVQGRSCDYCKDGTYNLQESNPDGCTKCFCFGKTSFCNSAFLRPFNVSMMGTISVNTIDLKAKPINIHKWPSYDFSLGENETSVEIDLTSSRDNDTVYFGVMEYLLDQNNHLSAYGGYLTYKILYKTNLFGEAIIEPDVILVGKHMTIYHQSYEQPSADHSFYGAVHMVETSFTTANGDPVTREQFMVLLRDIHTIYIRASYWEQSIKSKISDIYLTIADEDEENYNLYEELAVENCQCPPGYKGLSCEDCAPGYYRDPNGPYGGYCIPCQCNGHAATCDCETGVCKDCQHSTTGDHCEMCVEGYYGNATYGTPHDCMICACPLPVDSNNFATSCDISEDGRQIHCNCREGYTGAKCQSCDAGYYGQPEVEGEICRPCECSGNIDPSQIGSCDSVTGECIMCLNNTAGRACNLCAPGYFGDAIKLKDCQSCICDKTGTDYCDSFSGECQCLPNVIGPKCDRCEIDHYGFESGQGCRPCDCGVASNSTQCDDHSGECRCKPGVTGRQCDRCIPGYWNYSSSGCIPCSCNTDYSRGLGCNAQNGQCECLPGVVGEKCDHCPYRWVLISDTGCQECDVCHHALLDVTDSLKSQIDPVIIDFKTIATGFFTAQKLNYFSDLANQLEPQVNVLNSSYADEILTPLKQVLDALDMDTKSHTRKFSYTAQNANDSVLAGGKILDDVNDYIEDSRLIGVNAHNTIREVKKLVDSFSASDSNTIVENALNEAKSIVDSLSKYQFDKMNVIVQLENANASKRSTRDFIYPVNLIQDSVKNLNQNLGNYSQRLDDLNKYSDEVREKVADALKLHNKNNDSPVFAKYSTLSDQNKEIKDNIKMAQKLIKDTNSLVHPIYDSFIEIEKTNKTLYDRNKEADSFLENIEADYDNLLDQISAALNHSKMLEQTASDLEYNWSSITANSEQAIKAANAYTNIVDAVKNAQSAVNSADHAVGNAIDLADGIEERALNAYKNAKDIYEKVSQTHEMIQTELEPQLEKSIKAVEDVKAKFQQTDDTNTAINLALEQLKLSDAPDDVWSEAKPKAEKAIVYSKEALDLISPMNKQLSNDLKLARKMPQEVVTTNKNIAQATAQVDRIKDNIPKIKALIDEIEKKEQRLSIKESVLSERIGSLRKNLEMARDIANNVKVGVTFYPNTTLELKPPDNLPLLASYTKISTYFKTDKPNGFLFYLGNENKTDSDRPGKSNDFMALEIENGFPVLTTDLGGGPKRTIVQKAVDDNQWRQAIIERADNNVKLIIREELDNGTDTFTDEETVLPEQHQIFNLDENSRLFVGSYPPDYNIQDGIKYSSFEGQMEGLKIGDSDVGLWNFLDGQDNTEGALARDKLVSVEEPATGYRFGGKGYVIIDARPYSFRQSSSIHFKFKTSRSTKNGLLFYAEGNRNNYMSIEMRNGGISFQYRLGEHMVRLVIPKPLNDDQWHTIMAERQGRKGKLTIDNDLFYLDETPSGTEENLSITNSLFFGGYSGKFNHSEILNIHFDGCIDDVSITGTKVDLSQNKIAYGVRKGCPQKFSTVLSFAPNQVGYLRRPNFNTDRLLQINFKFKTRQEVGVLMYITNHVQSSTAALTIEHGSLVLRNMKLPLKTHSTRYDDGEWHTVNLAIDDYRMWMVVDDDVKFESHVTNPLIISNGDVYFGGLPKGFIPAKDAIGTTAYLTGCISEVTINSQVVNFADATDIQSAILDQCDKDIFDYDLANLKIYYPTDEYQPLPYPDDVLTEVEEEFDEKKHKEDEDFGVHSRFDSEEKQDTTIMPIPVHTTPTIPTKPTTISSTTTTTTTKKPISERLPLPPPVQSPPKVITTKRPKDKDQICELPLEPIIDVDFDAGYRFGTTEHGRIELQKVPSKMRKSYDIGFEFKSTEDSGLILYVSDRRHEYIAVYLHKGKLIHEFNSTNGFIKAESTNTYNDGEWHNVHFSRTKNRASITVDQEDMNSADGEVIDHSYNMNIVSPIFIGGVNPSLTNEMSTRNLGDDQFTGCIKNIHMFGKPTVETGSIHGVLPCSDQIETGVFFGKNGGYVKVRETFRVGLEMTISLDIKPRSPNGLLLSVHGKRAFLILELVNGTLHFMVDNGDGPIIAKFLPEEGENFCDGEWRTVTVIKSKYVISLQVNSINSEPAIGNALNPTTDTKRPLFLGGHPYLNKVRGVIGKHPYVGCIRNLKIMDEIEQITRNMAVGHVHTGVCFLN